ncbi:hypothetical protein [Streptomyces capuensis]|uniref:hypothetical protein n=1 Tax=Streptomyces capuensis TaxID=1464056 RepID=UPI000519CB61|nr:hypothetical protein [Streptomyces capuensis]
MIRRELLCDGRLVKEVDQVEMRSSRTGRIEYTDGLHRWLLDGEEVDPAQAEAFQVRWTAGTQH